MASPIPVLNVSYRSCLQLIGFWYHQYLLQLMVICEVHTNKIGHENSSKNHQDLQGDVKWKKIVQM